MSDLAKRVFQVFDPIALEASQGALYADLNQARGDGNVVEALKSEIVLNQRPTAQLLAGHSGSGKSTELKRLKQQLEQDGYFVVYFEAEEDLDRNDVDFLEVLVALVHQVVSQLHLRLELTLKPGWFQDRFQQLTKLLSSEVEFERLDLNTGLMKFASSLRSSPDHRARVRELLETDTGNWLEAANQVLAEASRALNERERKGLVVLFDDLDKMIVRAIPGTDYDTAEHLFLNRAASMTGFSCHVIYTMPITLTRQLARQRLRSFYDGEISVMAMTKLESAPPESKRFQPGWTAFRDMIRRRLDSIRVDEKKVFKRGARDDLIRISGGEPAALVRYIRSAAKTRDGLPISRATVRALAASECRSFTDGFVREHHRILAEVRDNPWFTPAEGEVDHFDQLLLSRAVLQYINDRKWYGLNPALADEEFLP